MDKNEKFWRRALNIRRQALAESETSSETEKETPSLSKRCSNHCTCKLCHNCSSCRNELEESGRRTSLIRSKSSLLSTQSESKVSNKVSSYKDKLETKIINDEMTEQLCYDKHNNSKKQIQDLSTLIRSIFSYAHSLDIRFNAAERLQKILSEIVSQNEIERHKEPSLISFSKKIKDVLSMCNKHIDIPADYYESCNEYSERYKDHAEAAFNFYYVLQGGDMSHSQMREYEVEYDRVRNQFSESKTSVASLLTNIIRQRSEVIEMCIEKLLPILSEMMDQDKDIFNMLKSLSSENLKSRSENIPYSKSLTKKSKSPRRKSDEGIGCKMRKERCCSQDKGDDF